MRQSKSGTLTTVSTGRKKRSRAPVKRGRLKRNWRSGCKRDMSDKLHLLGNSLPDGLFGSRADQLLAAIDENAIRDAILLQGSWCQRFLAHNDPVAKLARHFQEEYLGGYVQRAKVSAQNQDFDRDATAGREAGF